MTAMYQYTMIQWLFFFFFYCFFGWCFESTYVSLKKKQIVNRGFIRGPFLPLYGSGAIMMLLVSRPMGSNIVLIYLAGCVGATALEYVTGVTMEALFKVRYWDYSKNRFNFQGHICLGSTLCWGLLTVLATQFVHKPVEMLALAIPPKLLTAIVLVVLLYFTVDFTHSFRSAMDLRDILVKAELAKQELERMQKRLDVLIAVVSEDREIRKQEKEQRREELVNSIEAAFAQLKEAIPGSELLREKLAELLELREKFIGSRRVSEENTDSFIRSFGKRHMLKGNPDMISRKFRDTLEELKRSAQDYRKGKK